ncbi:MAG TPA: hypothetical protein VF678_16705 [bacterium]
MGLWTVLLVAVLLLSACGEEQKEEGLHGHFGPGQGTPPAGPAFTTIDITKESGSVVGKVDYDATFFATTIPPAASEEFGTLADNATPPTIVVTLIRITGREDTPCRFQAAVLARDQDYDILESGARENSHSLDFYQVNLKKGSQHLSLFCATLGDDVGTAIQVTTQSAALIKSSQVNYILNTTRKE